jgi:hypothetical protein
MKTQLIPLANLVAETTLITHEALSAAKAGNAVAPIVTPISADAYLVLDSVAKVAAQATHGTDLVECIVAPPMKGRRDRANYASLKDISAAPPTDSYKLVQRQSLSSSRLFEIKPSLNEIRGTVIKLYIDVRFGNTTITYFLNPLQHDIGALIFNPGEAINRFQSGSLDARAVMAAWGDDSYEPSTLPAAICIAEGGDECFGVGSRLDKSHMYRKAAITSAELELSSADLPPVDEQGRGIVESVSVLVLYPNGATFEGRTKVNSGSIVMLFSERLVSKLLEDEWRAGYFKESWWDNPTSLIMNVGPGGGECAHIEHTCNDCELVK